MSKATVLYVEDEEYDVLFMRRAFKQQGMEDCLQVVVDGQQAVEYLAGGAQFADRARHPVPDVVLLDLNLPMVSGFEVLEWIRSHPGIHDIPVIVFSSSARPEDKAQAEQLGANQYFEKPASAFDFPAVVKQLKTGWLGGAVAGL